MISMFVCSVISYLEVSCRTISLLVINTFVCSVILRWNELYLKVGLETPKRNRNWGKSFCRTSFLVGMDLYKVQKQGRDEKTREHYPSTMEAWRPPLWPPMQVHCIGGQRGGHHWSVVGQCSWVFSPFLNRFCPFYRSIPNLEWKVLHIVFP